MHTYRSIYLAQVEGRELVFYHCARDECIHEPRRLRVLLALQTPRVLLAYHLDTQR
jgi:hypothetical protein